MFFVILRVLLHFIDLILNVDNIIYKSLRHGLFTDNNIQSSF